MGPTGEEALGHVDDSDSGVGLPGDVSLSVLTPYSTASQGRTAGRSVTKPGIPTRSVSVVIALAIPLAHEVVPMAG